MNPQTQSAEERVKAFYLDAYAAFLGGEDIERPDFLGGPHRGHPRGWIIRYGPKFYPLTSERRATKEEAWNDADALIPSRLPAAPTPSINYLSEVTGPDAPSCPVCGAMLSCLSCRWPLVPSAPMIQPGDSLGCATPLSWTKDEEVWLMLREREAQLLACMKEKSSALEEVREFRDALDGANKIISDLRRDLHDMASSLYRETQNGLRMRDEGNSRITSLAEELRLLKAEREKGCAEWWHEHAPFLSTSPADARWKEPAVRAAWNASRQSIAGSEDASDGVRRAHERLY